MVLSKPLSERRLGSSHDPSQPLFCEVDASRALTAGRGLAGGEGGIVDCPGTATCFGDCTVDDEVDTEPGLVICTGFGPNLMDRARPLRSYAHFAPGWRW